MLWRGADCVHVPIVVGHSLETAVVIRSNVKLTGTGYRDFNADCAAQ